MFWFYSIVQKRSRKWKRKYPKRRKEERDSPSVGLTEKVKMETRNKRGSTGQSSVPSDLHSVTHTHMHPHAHSQLQSVKIALSHFVGGPYMKLISQLKTMSLYYTHICTHITIINISEKNTNYKFTFLKHQKYFHKGNI